MDSSRIEVPYNQDLKPLEQLLERVRRPGDFFVQGSFEGPMPRVEVEGVGVLSFPVPAGQIQELVGRAERAPYGRGGETILDPSVRQVWQLPSGKVQVGGKSWDSTFQRILSEVKEGLGCAEVQVSAELYKLLVYDEGGFFKAHRDTEKAAGMFGTLVVVLPSSHRGGELIVRHAGRELVLDLSSDEVSELKYAAFYADCEHEVRPITAGNRVCLVYNLLQSQGSKDQPLTAPLYQAEAQAAAEILKMTFKEPGAPAKLAWLLEHQYSPAGLSFDGLKGEDAALAKVLRQASEQANCAVHLGIVHIEENGAAQPDYDSYRGSRWRQYDEDGVEDDDASSDSFEVIEVSDSSRFVDQWRDTGDRAVDFGKLPLKDGEVLPDGALDDEDPDEQRLMEATGNEGASFERSYHRSTLVIWPRDRFADVLLQAGVGAVLPYLSDRVEALEKPAVSTDDREQVVGIAARTIDAWEQTPAYPTHQDLGKEASRGAMIQILGQLGDTALLQKFIAGVVSHHYDGSENEALAANARLLDVTQAGDLLSNLARQNMRLFPCACGNLLNRLTREGHIKVSPDWTPVLRTMTAAIVGALANPAQAPEPHGCSDSWRRQKVRPLDATTVADLFGDLALLEAPQLRTAASDGIIANPAVFNPGTVLVPALELLRARAGEGLRADNEYWRLWSHAAEWLLARSERPPQPPSDWRQELKLDCKCKDCAELQKFACSPGLQTYRFQVNKDRREHLHRQIDSRGLDMTHVTERKGSPQILVCTKTRRTFQHQIEQHGKDIAALTLLGRMGEGHPESAALLDRIKAAQSRAMDARPQGRAG